MQREADAMRAALAPMTIARTPVMVSRQLSKRQHVVELLTMFPRQSSLYQQCHSSCISSAQLLGQRTSQNGASSDFEPDSKLEYGILLQHLHVYASV